MTRAWRTAASLLLLAAACRNDQPPAQGAPTKRLELLTSLPLAFGEGFSLNSPRHPLMAALERDYRVTLVDGPEQLPPLGLLLAIQPQALTAERLVALDQWVRNGGRILLLADPRFAWQGSSPLGDKFRPPFNYPDTGLLRHWGLSLQLDQDGPALRTLGGEEILTGSPGRLVAAPASGCRSSGDGLVARCTIGRGRVVVVADADLVQAGQPGGLDGPTDRNHPALTTELDRLSRQQSARQ